VSLGISVNCRSASVDRCHSIEKGRPGQGAPFFCIPTCDQWPFVSVLAGEVDKARNGQDCDNRENDLGALFIALMRDALL
jgi:hypothetical protein